MAPRRADTPNSVAGSQPPVGTAHRYLTGEELWGDDLSGPDLEAWFEDEREAYANLVSGAALSARTKSEYGFGAFNEWYGFRHIRKRERLGRILAFGGADGGELAPVLDRVAEIHVVEPSVALRRGSAGGLPLHYVEPRPDGTLPFDDGSFDLVSCFGVLHHIANVSAVLREIGRVSVGGGLLLLREPVTSMGDWSVERPGLTKRERGIPPQLLSQRVQEAGFKIATERWCDFPTTRRLSSLNPRLGYGSRLGVAVDAALSATTAWNHRYHATRRFHKVRPISRFIVAEREM